MLGPDNSTQAGRSARLFAEFPGIRQFWDPNRLTGTAYREHVFPQAVARMDGSLPDDHFFKPYVTDRNPDQPEWDIYMFFEIGADWGDSPPAPSRFLRQTARFTTGDDELVSLMWRNDYTTPPIEGQVDDQLEILATEHLAGSPGAFSDTGRGTHLESIEFLAFPGCPNAATLRHHLDEALKRLDIIDVRVQAIDLEQLEPDDARLRYGAPTILINGLDLMGAKPLKTGALCCRTYDLGELPDQDEIQSRLDKWSRSKSGEKE